MSSLGMSKIPSGTSESYYHSFMTEFDECSRLKSLQTGSNETDITNQMLVNCKNTMSDKHIPGWEDMSEAQQENLSSLNRFHCGLHSLVNAATAAEDTIQEVGKGEHSDINKLDS